MDVPRGTNAPVTIDGIRYSGHAIDEMQSEGIMPSAVKDAIRNGLSRPGKTSTTRAFYSPENKITAIRNIQTGRVVTVYRGGSGQWWRR